MSHKDVDLNASCQGAKIPELLRFLWILVALQGIEPWFGG